MSRVPLALAPPAAPPTAPRSILHSPFSILTLCLTTLLGTAHVSAQTLSGSSFKIDRHTFSGTGSPVDAVNFTRDGSSFASFDVLGQPALDVVTGTVFNAKQGYLYEFFNPPSAPTALFANAAPPGAAAGLPSPIANLPTLSPVFSAVFSDPDPGDAGNKFQIQVSVDPTFTSVTEWDSGAAGTPIVTVANGARSADIPYAGSPLAYGGVTYFWRIKFWDTTGEEGTFSAAADFTTSASLSITTVLLPDGVVGSPYSQALLGAGGFPPYAWSLSGGALPAGLALDPATGLISGTPAGPAGFSSFSVDLADATTGPPQAPFMAFFSIGVADDLMIVTTSLPGGVVGSPYSASVAAAGGNPPVVFSVSGTLPAGLTLDPATGLIGGTPSGPAGTSSFSIVASDGTSPIPDTFAQPLSIAVASDLAIVTAALPTATLGAPYAQTLASAGGNPPAMWNLLSGTLPAGLSLDPVTGAIAGIPTTMGLSSFVVEVFDSTSPAPDTASRPLSISVAAGPLTIATAAVPNGTRDAFYSATLAAAGGAPPYAWSVTAGALPAGLSLDPATGDLAGLPAANGTFAFTAQVSDAQTPPATASQSYTLLLNPALTLTTLTLPNASITRAYNATLGVTGGQAPYSFNVTIGSLPPGLSLDAVTGSVSGLPTTLGTSAFTLEAMDSTPAGPAVDSRSFTIQVFAVEAPINLSAISANGQVDLSWDPVLGAGTYNVHYGNTSTGLYDGTDAVQGPSPVRGIALNSVTLTGLSNTKTYYIAVSAQDGGVNEGPPSAEITAKPLPAGIKSHTRVLAAGELPEDYRMIGWPVLPSNQDPIANLADDLGPYDDTLWRLFRWNALTAAYEETPATGAGSHKVEPGAGYWILARSGGTVGVTGSLADGSKDFDIALQPGWNMFGHPWDFPVDLSECKADGVPLLDPANVKTRQDVWDYTGDYLSVSELVSGRAYWIKNLMPVPVTFSIPPVPSQTIATPVATTTTTTTPTTPPPTTVPKPAWASAAFRRAASGDDLPPPPPGSGAMPILTIAGLKHDGGDGEKGGGPSCFTCGSDLPVATTGKAGRWAPALLGVLIVIGLASRRLRTRGAARPWVS